MNVGDTVRLASGGLEMTVISINDNRCVCAWFQAQTGPFGMGAGYAIEQRAFPIEALRVVTKADIADGVS